MSAPDTLAAAVDALGATAHRIKRERDCLLVVTSDLLAAARSARAVIAHDRAVLVDSFKDRGTGRVTDRNALPWLDEYDATLAALDAAIAKATPP
jgi:hypothetical protein